MLRLLRHELLDEDGVAGVLVFGTLCLIILRLLRSFVLPLLPVEGNRLWNFIVFAADPLPHLLAVATLFLIIIGCVWGLIEKERSYLLFTLPQPAYKIMSAKLLGTLPLWIMSVIFIISYFPQGLAEISRLFPGTAIYIVILNGTVVVYTFVIVAFFGEVLRRKILSLRYHKWYYRQLWWLKFIGIGGGVVLFRRYLWLFLSQSFFSAEMLLLVAVNIILFFVTAYLLENKVDIWE